MPRFADRVRDVTATTGPGPLTLAGTPPAGYRRFGDAFGVGATVYYTLATDTQWEVGSGTLTSATVLSRDSVLASSNAGALVNFAVGSKSVFSALPAEMADRLINPVTDPVVALKRMGRDANGIYTTVEYRRGDGSLAMRSVLSGGTPPAYGTRTATRYDSDGATLLETVTLALTYSGGELVLEA